MLIDTSIGCFTNKACMISFCTLCFVARTVLLHRMGIDIDHWLCESFIASQKRCQSSNIFAPSPPQKKWGRGAGGGEMGGGGGGGGGEGGGGGGGGGP